MEIETPEASNKRLNGLVAATVVVLSVFMAVCGIKAANIVQGLQVAKAEEAEAWNEYQGSKLKLYVADASLSQLRVQAATANPGPQTDSIAAESAKLKAIIDKQTAQIAEQMEKAKSYKPQLDELNFKDDQFDLSEAFISIAIAVAAVAALVESFLLLFFAWGAGGFGIIMGLAGFLNWGLHPGWLISLLT